MNTKKITLLGIMLSMMLILGFVEKQFSLVPGVPGIKPGFSNIVLMFALYRMDTRSAGTLLVLKVLLSGLLFSGVNGMAYAFSGGILAFGIMFLFIRMRRLSLPVVSVSGAVMHMAGQIICSRFLMGSWVLAFQLPLLLVSAVVTGVLNGVITALVINALTKSKLSFLPGKAAKEVKNK
ncbi:MAG: Gx transporter family protein [Clostridia bacterium]|nr:Gx transporter family protein [Clostridia bacterium]